MRTKEYLELRLFSFFSLPSTLHYWAWSVSSIKKFIYNFFGTNDDSRSATFLRDTWHECRGRQESEWNWKIIFEKNVAEFEGKSTDEKSHKELYEEKRNFLLFVIRHGHPLSHWVPVLPSVTWNFPNGFSIKCFYPPLEIHLYLMITIFSRTCLLSKQLILSDKRIRHYMGNIYNDRQKTRKISILRPRRKKNKYIEVQKEEKSVEVVQAKWKQNALPAITKISKYNDGQQKRKIIILRLRRKKNP